MAIKFKKINAWLHLWLGLVSGIVVFILGITGSILVFEQKIKSLISPWLHAEKVAGQEMLAPSHLYNAVAKAIPGADIHSVWYHGEGRTAHFSLHSDSVVHVNPYTAEVAAITSDDDFFHFIDEGHTRLWLPEAIGHQIAGWGTFIFFLLLITGIILWWPKKWNKRGREQSFKIKWKARFKRLNYDIHNVLGFYALIVAVVFAFTGLIMSFSWFSNGVYWLAGGEPFTRQVALSDTTTTLRPAMLSQADKAWHMAITQIGEYNPKDVIISFPEEASEAIYVCTDMYRGTWRDVFLDQYTLKELPATQGKLKDTDLATWIRRSNYGLHVGEIGGLTTKIIYFFASLICASLPVTGFLIWWGRKKKQKKQLRNR